MPIPRIPYDLLPVVAVIWLTARHYFTSPASDQAKRRLCIVVALTVVASPIVPLAAALAQVAICVYILLHQTVAEEVNREQ